MADKFDDYRAFAAYCEKMFREAQTMDAKTAWLRLAENWLALIPRSENIKAERDVKSSVEPAPADPAAPDTARLHLSPDDVN